MWRRLGARPDGSFAQLRRNDEGMLLVLSAPTGRVVRIRDCGSFIVDRAHEVPVCRRCLAREGVRRPREQTTASSIAHTMTTRSGQSPFVPARTAASIT